MDRTEEILRKLDAIDARLQGTREQLIELRARVDTALSRLDNHERDLADLDKRIDQLETDAAERKGEAKRGRMLTGGVAAGAGGVTVGIVELLRALLGGAQ